MMGFGYGHAVLGSFTQLHHSTYNMLLGMCLTRAGALMSGVPQPQKFSRRLKKSRGRTRFGFLDAAALLVAAAF